jgi:cytochrome oxidase Cu insertion factor (SCO1/SenC/PrrC family)
MLRTPEALVPYILALACFAAGGLWHAADMVHAPGRVVTHGTPNVGGPLALLDQNGATKTDADFRGRWMWVYFGYTHCPDVCPTTLVLMSEVLKRLGARANRIAPIFVTVDPQQDTPKVLKAYLASFDPRFVGLTGPQSHIASVAAEYHVYSVKRPLPGGGYAIDHSSVICLMDPHGKFAASYDNSQGPDEIAADLKKRL